MLDSFSMFRLLIMCSTVSRLPLLPLTPTALHCTALLCLRVGGVGGVGFGWNALHQCIVTTIRMIGACCGSLACVFNPPGSKSGRAAHKAFDSAANRNRHHLCTSTLLHQSLFTTKEGKGGATRSMVNSLAKRDSILKRNKRYWSFKLVVLGTTLQQFKPSFFTKPISISTFFLAICHFLL